MKNKFSITVSATINAPVSKVWDALTNPALIKEYMFDTDAVSDWKKGSSLTFTGEWEGKAYTDKGIIVDIVPEKLLHTTYYSPMSGKPDMLENYANVIYELTREGEATVLTISQDNIENEASVPYMEKNWNLVLDSMKELIE